MQPDSLPSTGTLVASLTSLLMALQSMKSFDKNDGNILPFSKISLAAICQLVSDSSKAS